MELLGTLCVGVGWIIGVTISMIIMPISGNIEYSFLDAMGNTLVFGFPGFIMFIFALILSLKDDADTGKY
jgi:hypothetical protein